MQATRRSPGFRYVVEFLVRPAVQDGVVTLEGTVPNPFTRRQAGEIVLGINGVRRVINHIEVQRKAE